MVLPLPWLSRYCCRCLLLPSWPLAPQGSWRCCSHRPKASTKEQTNSTGSGKIRTPMKVRVPAVGEASMRGDLSLVKGNPLLILHHGLKADANPVPWSLLPRSNSQLPSIFPSPTPLYLRDPSPNTPPSLQSTKSLRAGISPPLRVNYFWGRGKGCLSFPSMTFPCTSCYSPWASDLLTVPLEV